MPDPKRNPSTPRYGYNTDAGRYVDLKSGRFVPRATIKAITNRQITKSRNEMLSLTEQLKSGNLSLKDYRAATMQQMKVLHVSQAAAAKGGWAQMTQADYGRVGGKLRFQYSRFDRMCSQIQYGTQPLDGRLTTRVQMYANAGRATFVETERASAEDRGMDEERRVLGGGESCSDCIEYAARGWQPIGTLPPIGDSVCLTNCQCEFETRRER